MQPPGYPFPWQTLARLVIAILTRKPLSFRAEARASLTRIQPPVAVHGIEHIPAAGPCLITINHYHRPGFASWWLTLAISSLVPCEVRWVITSAWTSQEHFPGSLLTPLTRWAFPRVAAVYGFFSMPPMPPDPRDTQARAKAVRRVLDCARQNPRVVIGLAPEGEDQPDGVLRAPPPGAGRFMLHLSALGLVIHPAGIYESHGCLHVRFGAPYRLVLPAGLSGSERDALASEIVMRRIAALLPVELQGAYSGHPTSEQKIKATSS